MSKVNTYVLTKGSHTRVEKDGAKRYVKGEQIKMTEEEAAKHVGRLRLIVGSNPSKALKLPKDWEKLTKPKKLTLASKISAKKVEDITEAEMILAEYEDKTKDDE